MLCCKTGVLEDTPCSKVAVEIEQGGHADSSPMEARPKGLSEATSVDFTICLEKPSSEEPLNIDLTYDDKYKYLVIRRPTGKSMRKYQLANPKKLVRPGDQIISVNGKTGDAHILIECLSDLNAAIAKADAAATPHKDVELVLRRYVRFTVDVEWKQEQHGLKFNEGLKTKVTAVQDGLIQTEWNGSSVPSLDVYVGDQLVEVNGATSDFEEELRKRKEGSRLRLVFVRPGLGDANAE